MTLACVETQDPAKFARQTMATLKRRALSSVQSCLLQSTPVQAAVAALQQTAHLKGVLTATDELPPISRPLMKDRLEKETARLSSVMAAIPPHALYHQLENLFDCAL